MRTALYYPHTEIQSERLVRSALLTWDRVETIVPWRGYRGHYEDRAMAEAMELLGDARSPSDDHKRQVHALLEDLLTTGVPETFLYRTAMRHHEDYEMWPQKLMHETWQMLRDNDLIGELLDDADYPASQTAGLTIMSMLADVMAGETRARITDRGIAYATIANLPGVTRKPAAAADGLDRVVPLTFKSISLDQIDLGKLVAFRKREAKASGHHYRALRHLYLDRLEEHLAEAAKFVPGSDDREELDRVFEEEMEDDLRDLKDELGVARRDALLSKDTLTFALAGGALLAAGVVAAAAAAPIVIPAALTLTGAPATIGGMLSTSNKYAAKRREILRKHPMAYMYEVDG
ncbi:hypothetical protein [Sphingomonas sp.]|uniref:hypothetical protein n=1 Tax=Sphingomonas sp. TaxID=28214 RepID=UPI0025DE7250|nr:hypothetical protein [Sphingomonas sp.]